MAAPFRLAPAAEEQVGDIVAFIAADSEDAAVRVRNAFCITTFELLATQPEIGHAREDLTSQPVKFWRVYSYLVVMTGRAYRSLSLAVLHGARDVGQDIEGLILFPRSKRVSDASTFIAVATLLRWAWPSCG